MSGGAAPRPHRGKGVQAGDGWAPSYPPRIFTKPLQWQVRTTRARSGTIEGVNDNLGVQFGQTPRGLVYRRANPEDMRRAWVSDPAVEPTQRAQHRGEESARHDYWSPELRITRGKQNQVLKRPRIGPNPNVSDPHTVAFADFHDETMDPERRRLYVDYVTTRGDQQGQGHARRLLEGIADAHPGTRSTSAG
jgi:hypothetical protein